MLIIRNLNLISVQSWTYLPQNGGKKIENTALFPQLDLHVLSGSKSKLFQNTLQTGGMGKCQLWVLLWNENVLKKTLFKKDDVTIIT